MARPFGQLQCGHLLIDDPVISARFAKWIEGISRIFDSESKLSILGLNIVLIA
jgi:hypothetical protein